MASVKEREMLEAQTGDPRYTNMSDDWYDQAIEQYRGTSYYDTLASNPYLVRNAAGFQPSAGDKFAEAFGDRSAGNRYYADLHNRAAGYLNEQIEKMRQEGVNLAPGQVQQLRAAGVNPDLQGVVAGNAAENDQPFSPVDIPEATHPQQIFGEVAQLALNAYSFASGFASDMLSFQQMRNTIEGSNLENDSKLQDIAMRYIRNHVGRPYFDEDDHKWVIDTPFNDLDEFSSQMFSSRRLRNRFKRQVLSSASSASARLAQITDATDYEKAKLAFGFAVGDNQAFGYNYSNSDDNIAHSYVIQDPFIQLCYSLRSLKKELDTSLTNSGIAKSGYEGQYYSERDAVGAAQADNAGDATRMTQYEAAGEKAKIDKIVNKRLESIFDDLEKCASDPNNPYNLLAKGMLLYYSCFGLTIPSIPGISK